MKIYIRNALSDPNKHSGKGRFCCKLSHALRSLGVQMTGDKSAFVDASINVSRIENYNAKAKIIRIDGIYHNTSQNYLKKNTSIKKNFHSADGIIYQADFSRKMCEKYLGVPETPFVVIPNGSKPLPFDVLPSPKVKEKNIFFTYARWRPHKRLSEMIKCFLHANIKDSILFVAGDLKKARFSKPEKAELFKSSKVEYLGILSHNQLASYLKITKAVLYLSWIDWCPNSVVEAIVSKVPVICGNIGGTKEIVAPSGGYVCKIDKEYDMNPINLYDPPPINRNVVAEAMRKCCQEKPKIENNHVLIENVAKQYLSFIEKVL
ncbi:MAG: glycosyltransferase [Candidatus Heimdallarchaeaceae archaeon]